MLSVTRNGDRGHKMLGPVLISQPIPLLSSPSVTPIPQHRMSSGPGGRRPPGKNETLGRPRNGVGERFLSFMLFKICVFFSNFRYGSDIQPRPQRGITLVATVAAFCALVEIAPQGNSIG